MSKYPRALTVHVKRPNLEYLRSRGLQDQEGSEQRATRSGSVRGHGSATRDQREQRVVRSCEEPRCYDEKSQGSNASQWKLALEESHDLGP
ncbi:hypothetical protein ACOSP7_014878 [Xanthoceras sorbifolium]